MPRRLFLVSSPPERFVFRTCDAAGYRHYAFLLVFFLAFFLAFFFVPLAAFFLAFLVPFAAFFLAARFFLATVTPP